MLRVLIATQNQGKVKEFRRLFARYPQIEWVGTGDVGLGDVDVDETGDTFDANARLKAQAFARASGLMALADDSGLAVDALNGAPGVYSARYGGAGLDEAGRRVYLLSQIAHVPDEQRTARFVSVIAIARPDGTIYETVTGVCEGHILRESRGTGGFGYDPLFVPHGHTLTFAEMSLEVKNDISHRARAAQVALPVLERLIAQG